MSFFNKTEVKEPVSPPAPVTPPTPPDVSKDKVGAKLGNLTQLGEYLWINFDEVVEISMIPPDSCGAEIVYKNGKTCHLTEYGKALLVKYIEQERAGLTELENLGNL
jgi:hypothetical protein